jgi:hypothetical protein
MRHTKKFTQGSVQHKSQRTLLEFQLANEHNNTNSAKSYSTVTLPHGRGSVTPSASQSIFDLFNKAPKGEGTRDETSWVLQYLCVEICRYGLTASLLHRPN